MRLLPLITLLAVIGTALRGPTGESVKVGGKRNVAEGLFNPIEGLLKRGPFDAKTLVLTFDDGPHPDSCAHLLDELSDLNAKATFFVVGERVDARPDLVRRMIAEGHEVGNHTQDHPRLVGLKPEKLRDEILRCGASVRRATGRSMSFMRPPGMEFDPGVLTEARAQGYIVVGYNSGAKDYVPGGGLSDFTPEEAESLGMTPQLIAERVESQIKGGTLILLHDNPITVAAVPEIVRWARAQGYRFVTTAELMASLPEPVRIVANPPMRKPETGKRK